jgi:subtilisin family serine protease
MKKTLLLVLIVLTVLFNAKAQRYIIRFKDKGSSTYTLNNSSAYLSERAIQRRQRFSIAIDSTDLPITERYLDSLKAIPGVFVLNASKWLNQVSILVTDPNALNKINTFPFVLTSARIANRLRTDVNLPAKEFEGPGESVGSPSAQRITTDVFSYGNSFEHVHIHNGEFLHNIGLRGQNMIIGMLDAGFQNYTGMTSLDSARNNGQILGTWDFVDRHSSVVEDNAHGSQCLSLIASNIPGTLVGTAPKANFYLFKTEDVWSEYPIEEHNWVCGAERVDSAGGDLISSSLGYRTFDDPSLNHTYADMNGNTTMAAIGADLAAKKGILVVAAAGNDGNSGWHYILTPADGDSVLAVGAVNTSGQPWSGSSYGPSADGRVKPDVAAVGQGAFVQYPNNTIGSGNGTSYACPNMAGLTTCLMQGFPEFNNMKIIKALRQAGSNVATPNDRIGYGIPDMKKAVMSLLKEFASSSATVADCKSTISWTSKDVATMKYEIERKAPNETSFKKIKEIPGTGSVFSIHSYSYNDTLYGLATGTASYRIKQVIDTASATLASDYIDTVTIEVNSLCSLNDLNVLLNSLKATATSNVSFANCKTTLSWASFDRLGMKYEIERKTTTETAFQKIAEENGTGNTFAKHSYEFNDNLAGFAPGIITYRIKQIIDTNAATLKAAYIDTASADIIPACNLSATISLMPNPAKNQFILQTTIVQPIEQFIIRIVNSEGQTVALVKKVKPAGIQNFPISIPYLSSGKYYVSVYDNKQMLATKLLVKL